MTLFLYLFESNFIFDNSSDENIWKEHRYKTFSPDKWR